MKHLLIIAILGFAVYVNSLGGEFIWDDEVIIQHNPTMANWAGVSKVFTRDLEGGKGERTSYYRPIQLITYMMDFSLWKLTPAGYHLTNILLHILVALTLYWLINILYGNTLLAFFTSLLFIAHPIHTGAVAYIAGRADLLAALFMLLCFIFCIKETYFKRPISYILIILTFSLALMSKEKSLILPALLLLYYHVFKKKFNKNNFLIVLTILFIYIVFRMVVVKGALPSKSEFATLLERIPGFFVAITNYTRIVLLPINLHMEYGNKVFYFANPKAILGLAILCLSLFYAFLKRNDNKLVFFSILWIFITLLPVSNIYPLNAYMAEHWLYVPSMGLFLIMADSLRSMYALKKFRDFAVVIVLSMVTFWSCLTIRQNEYWRERIAFYKRTLRYAPDSARIYNNLGLAYYTMGRRNEAIALYRRAIELEPRFADAYHNLGAACTEMDKKIFLFKKALKLDPSLTQARIKLCSVYAALGMKKEAIDVYKNAVVGKIDYADVYNKVALIYHDIKKDDDAIELLKRAMKIAPNHVQTYSNLAAIYGAAGKKDEAIALLNKAIEIDPKYSKAYNNLAVVYFNDKQYGEAIKYCDKAKRLGFTNLSLTEALKPYRKIMN